MEMMNESGKKELNIEVNFVEDVSRLFIFRGFKIIPLMFTVPILGIFVGVLSTLHMWYMFFLGKRSQSIWAYEIRFRKWLTAWNYYFKVVTNESPKFWW